MAHSSLFTQFQRPRHPRWLWPLAGVASVLVHGLGLVLTRSLMLETAEFPEPGADPLPISLVTLAPEDLAPLNAPAAVSPPNVSETAVPALADQATGSSAPEAFSPPAEPPIPTPVSPRLPEPPPRVEPPPPAALPLTQPIAPSSPPGSPPDSLPTPQPPIAEVGPPLMTPPPGVEAPSPFPEPSASPPPVVEPPPPVTTPTPDQDAPVEPALVSPPVVEPPAVDAPPGGGGAGQGGELLATGIRQNPQGRDIPEVAPQLTSNSTITVQPLPPQCSFPNLGVLFETVPTAAVQLQILVEPSGRIARATVLPGYGSGSEAVDRLVSCLVQERLQLVPASSAGAPQLTDAFILETRVRF